MACELDVQVAVVTGTSWGLGRRFASEGHAARATVVVGARRLDVLATKLGDHVLALLRRQRRPRSAPGRQGRPEEFDGVLLPFTEQARRYIHAQTLQADSGWAVC